MVNDNDDTDKISYIKESLDRLHEKVDKVYVDADARLKSLEETRAHERGFSKAVGIMGGMVGGFVTLIASYFIYHDPK